MAQAKLLFLIICMAIISYCGIRYLTMPTKQEIQAQKLRSAEYSKCFHSSEIRFMVEYHKQKYPRLPDDIIADTLCRK